MGRVRVTPSIDLEKFANEQVQYEVAMYLEARRRLSPGSSIGLDMNFHVEGFALHLRNLLDFFYLERPKPDDVIAVDYVPNWEVRRPAMTPLLKAARERANKEMAHLTTLRKTGTPDDKIWNCETISSDLKPVVAEFLACVDPKLFAGEFVSYMRAI